MIRPTQFRRLLLGAALALGLVAALHGAGPASADERPVLIPRAVPVFQVQVVDRNLGGLNLDSYCKHLGKGKSGVRNGRWVCYTASATTAIDFSLACVWAYGDYAYPVAEPNNALAVNCHIATGPLGGLNLDSYCKDHNGAGSLVRNGQWICYEVVVARFPVPIRRDVAIDFADACRWAYSEHAYPVAEANNPLAITCYH